MHLNAGALCVEPFFQLPKYRGQCPHRDLTAVRVQNFDEPALGVVPLNSRGRFDGQRESRRS